MPAQTIRLGRRRHGDNKTSLDGAGVRAADRRTGPQASQKRSFRDEAQCSCYLRLDLRPGWHTYRIRATWVLDTQFAGITWRPRSATREIGAPVVNQRAVGTDNLLIVGRHAKTILDCITLAEARGYSCHIRTSLFRMSRHRHGRHQSNSRRSTPSGTSLPKLERRRSLRH
jgi:hypothetical protein